MTGARRENKARKVLKTWRDVMQALPNMSEQELKTAISIEKEKSEEERRKDILWRIHRRYCVVRADREMEELGLKDYFEQNKSRARETTKRVRRAME